MSEANTSYLLQTPSGVDAKLFCASLPAFFSRTQSEFGLACVNEVSASKQANKQASSTARPRLTLRRPVVSHSRNESATFSFTNSCPSPTSGALRGTLLSGQRTASTSFMPTWVSPYPCRHFSFRETHKSRLAQYILSTTAVLVSH